MIVLLAVGELCGLAIIAHGADDEDVGGCVAAIALHAGVVTLVPLVKNSIGHKHVVLRQSHRNCGLVSTASRTTRHQRDPPSIRRPSVVVQGPQSVPQLDRRQLHWLATIQVHRVNGATASERDCVAIRAPARCSVARAKRQLARGRRGVAGVGLQLD